MKDHTPLPFPGPNGSPGLPPMSPQERAVWMASHNAPANILLVTREEMLAMKDSFDAGMREVKEWRRIGRMYLGADIPESAEPALRGVIAAKDQAKEKAKISGATRPQEL